MEKNLKESKAITLIALVITVVVLIILAGVAISLSLGQNGILVKANIAKNKTEVAKYEEELKMCMLDLQTELIGENTTISMEIIKNRFTEKVKEQENTIDIEFPIDISTENKLDGIYKGYEFYIDNNYEVHIGKKATGIRIITNIEPKGYTKEPVTAIITIKAENGLSKIVPQGENEITLNGDKEYKITKEKITENATFAYEVTDSQGNVAEKKAIINTIDRLEPNDFEITATVTEEGIEIMANPQDAEKTEKNACSGIEKIEYYVKNETNEISKYETNIIKELKSGTYSVYAIAYDKAGNKKQSTNTEKNLKVSAVYKNITAQMIAEHPELYYGLTVTNYESQNGQKDWKIFYSDWNENPDDAHIFLITSDFVDVTDGNGNIDQDKLNPNTNMVKIGDKYGVCWEHSKLPTFQTDIKDEVLNRFKAKGYNINEHKYTPNSKCVSALLNTENWEKYKDSSEKAEYAIGGATLELLKESFNNKHKDKKICCDSYGKYGYYVREENGNNGDTIIYNDLKDNLYVRLAEVYDKKTRVIDYWLASPSETIINDYNNAYNYGVFMYTVGRLIDPHLYWNADPFQNATHTPGLRPVVSLKQNVTVNAKDSE